MVNLFGKGFVGTRYCEMVPEVRANKREDYTVHEKDVLYMISTIDNYNVWNDPYIDIETNLITLMKVLESFRKLYPDGTFNFISSWFVYGTVELPAREDAHCDPKGFYSITKRTAEQLIISYCDTFDLKYRILRLPNVLGNQDKKVSKKKNALQYMLRQVQNNETIGLYEGGYALRDFMYVDDVCMAIHTVLTKGNTNEIYNIGSGVGISVRQCIEYAIQKTGSTSKIDVIDTAAFHKKVQATNMLMDNTKLRNLGFTPKYSINEILDILLT